MGTNHSRVFDPLDLEIIERVYEAAWAQVEAREPSRDRERDDERQQALSKRVLAFAGTGHEDFDTLLERVLASMPDLPPKTEPKVEVRSPEPGAPLGRV